MLTLIPLLAVLAPLAHAASGQGTVSLWTGYSCDPDSALNYTLDVDTCSTPGPIIHSYIIGERPTCDNGTAAAFAFYHANDCHAEGFGSALNNIFYESDGVDGLCLGLVELNSVAFICDGVGASGGRSSSVLASSSVSSVVSATPVAPSGTMASPLYPTITAFPTIPPYPSGTGASVGLPSGTLGSSPAAFTGAAVKMGASLIAIVGGFAATLLL